MIGERPGDKTELRFFAATHDFETKGRKESEFQIHSVRSPKCLSEWRQKKKIDKSGVPR